MKKVYQQKIDKDTGDCIQAVVASLFEVELSEVPKFIELGDNWWYEYKNYFKSKGYFHKTTLYSPVFWDGVLDEFSISSIGEYSGVNGFFKASVCSPMFNPDGNLEGICHAVVVDKSLNVIHDPNPNNINVIYPRHDDKYKGIRQIEIFEKL